MSEENGNRRDKRATLLNSDFGAANLVGRSHESYCIRPHPCRRVLPPRVPGNIGCPREARREGGAGSREGPRHGGKMRFPSKTKFPRCFLTTSPAKQKKRSNEGATLLNSTFGAASPLGRSPAEYCFGRTLVERSHPPKALGNIGCLREAGVAGGKRRREGHAWVLAPMTWRHFASKPCFSRFFNYLVRGETRNET